MVAGFTRTGTTTIDLKQLVFTPIDIDTLFTERGINPPDNTSFDISVITKSGSQVLIGRLIPTDSAVIFSYNLQSYSSS